jgi:hypothetical protein
VIIPLLAVITIGKLEVVIAQRAAQTLLQIGKAQQTNPKVRGLSQPTLRKTCYQE